MKRKRTVAAAATLLLTILIGLVLIVSGESLVAQSSPSPQQPDGATSQSNPPDPAPDLRGAPSNGTANPGPGNIGQPQYPAPYGETPPPGGFSNPNGFAPPPNGFAPGQNGFMPPGGMVPPPGYPLPPARPRLMKEYSWIYIDVPPPRRMRVHDIITVIVDEKSQTTELSTFLRQKNGIFKAELQQFVRIDNQGNLNTAAPEDPQVNGNLQASLNARGQLSQQEGVKYRIAATVVDIRPNGNLVLEARKCIRTNIDLWEYRLAGEIRPEDVLSNNTALSENIADLQIIKRETGRVKDSTKRGWMIYLYDLLGPW